MTRRFALALLLLSSTGAVVLAQTADVPLSIAAPQPDPNDPPVSVLPGETPITVIGTPDSTSQTP